jgi:uncharacterized protein YkwD
MSPRRTAAILLAAAGALLAGGPPAHAAACPNADVPGASATAEAAVRCLVDAERAGRGLGPLRPSARLRAAASAFSAQMVARRFFDHVSPGGSTPSVRAARAGYRARSIGEAIGWGTAELSTPASIVDIWMHSPPHRAILLNRRVREIGVGVAAGTPDPTEPYGAVYVLDVARR